MKTLLTKLDQLKSAARWDIDFHLPAEGIKKFPKEILRRVDDVADVVRNKRDPSKEPDNSFQYIDISAEVRAKLQELPPLNVDGSVEEAFQSEDDDLFTPAVAMPIEAGDRAA